ncbi:MAG: M56 family metallopeptidase [Acidobacteriota bacterium]
MDRILGFLFDVVWIWYVPTLIEGLIVAVILLSLESLLARSRRMWLEVRTIVLYLIFLKLIVPPQLSLPTGLISQAVGWMVSRLQFLPLAWAGGGATASGSLPGQDVLWAYLRVEPLAALAWIWAPLMAWLPGFLFFMASTRRQTRELRHLVRESAAPPADLLEALIWAGRRLHLRNCPRLRVSIDISAPLVFGLRKPTILFPSALIGQLSAQECRHIFLHELAHVRRRDGWLQSGVFILHSLFWPNLLLHAARRRLNRLQDLGSDATAIYHGPKDTTAAYRRMLLKVAGTALGLSSPASPQTLGLLRRPALIEERLRFMDRRFRFARGTRMLAAGASAILIALFLFPMGARRMSRPTEELPADPVAPLVEAVEFSGNQSVSDNELLQLIETRAGRLYDRARLFKDLGSLSRTHLFQEVEGRLLDGQKGLIVRFELHEIPIDPDRRQ